MITTMSHPELKAAGYVELAGPFSRHEEIMMPGFINDAIRCNKEVAVAPLYSPSGSYRGTAKMIWQRAKR